MWAMIFWACGVYRKFEIGLGDLAGALGHDIGVDHRDRRLGQDRGRRHDDLELVGAEFVTARKASFPRRSARRRGALGEVDRGAAGPGVEDRHVLDRVADEVADLGFVAANLSEARPRLRDSSSAPPPDVFGLGVITADAGLDQVVPSP